MRVPAWSVLIYISSPGQLSELGLATSSYCIPQQLYAADDQRTEHTRSFDATTFTMSFTVGTPILQTPMHPSYRKNTKIKE
ncbi:hypothetical protein JB92DRAFT_2989012, partial [Gautieria morchelliformis]